MQDFLITEEVENVMLEVLNKDGSVAIGKRIESQEILENWGRYAVPALMDILVNHGDEAMQSSQQVNVSPSMLVKDYRRNFEKSNQRTKRTTRLLLMKPTPLRANILVWRHGGGITKEDATGFGRNGINKSDWEYSAGDKVSIMLFDTRFAKYWSNLFQLNSEFLI